MNAIRKKEIMGVLILFIVCIPFYIFAANTDSEAFSLLAGTGVLFAVFTLHIAYQNRKTQALLCKERDRLAKTLDCIPLPLFVVDENHCIKLINQSTLDLFQCKGTMVGQPCHKLNTCICHTPECSIEQMEHTGNGRSYYHKEGKSYMVSTAALDFEQPSDGKYIELIQDITEIVETQKALEEKTIELETMSENMIGGVLITTMSEGFPVIRCNQGYRDMIQKEEQQIIGQRALQWVAAEDVAELTKIINDQLACGNNVNIEHRLHGTNDSFLWVLLRGKRTVLRGQEVGVWILTDISGKKETERNLRVDEERYRIAMQSIEDIIIDYDMITHVMYHSSKAKDIYGVPELLEHMPQSILDNGTVLAESKNDYLDLFRQLEEGVKGCSGILKTRAADGRILWNRLTFTAIFDDEGKPVRAIGILQDISREKSVEFQYKREARYLEMSGKEGTSYYEVDVTHRRFLSGHENNIEADGQAKNDDLGDVLEQLMVQLVYEPDRELVRTQLNANMLTRDYEAGILHKSIEYRRCVNGEPLWVHCSIQLFFDEDTQSLHCVGCVRNINEMKQKELSLQQKAERDLLTGLYNKMTTELRMKAVTEAAAEAKIMGAFLLIDLDSFKNVNDKLGHAFGDAVLAEVAHELLALFQESDVVGRIGGDEFAVYINNLPNEKIAIQKAQQICHRFHCMYTGLKNDYKISGTIGIAMFPAHGKNFAELYQNADSAMYYAKAQGKDSYAVYSDALPTEH